MCTPPENTVIYRLFLSKTEKEDAGLDRDLTCLAVKCTELARQLSEDHVWHYEPFTLGVRPQGPEESTYPPHLYGSLCYHDNVEDEWLVVWLLLEISKQLPHLIASICDDDGAFLLIEAAHCLPKWLQPETAENRVFLYRGLIHILPKPLTPADISRYPVTTPTIQEAIDLISNPAVPTEASPAVQEAIQHRISGFPTASMTGRHRAHCYVPWPVCHVISHDPSLVAAAVHALCDRGPADMKAVRSMAHFSPSSHSSLLTQVTFTRCLYAKLLHQRFSPPPYSGFTKTTPTSHTHKSYDLGMKLTCGLEMLVCSVGGVRGGDVGDVRGRDVGDVRGRDVGDVRRRDVGETQDLSTDPRWIQFLKTLQEKDYFQGELEGSRKYQKLLSSARDYFIFSISPQTEHGREDERSHRDPLRAAGLRVVQILTSDPRKEEDVRRSCNTISPPDDDGWLEISPADLDAMMIRAAGYQPQSSAAATEGGDSSGQCDDKGRGKAAKDMVHGIKSFVDTVSSHEGAELPWSAEPTEGVKFDTETVLGLLEEMMGKGGGGDDVTSDSGESGSVNSEEEEDMREMMEQMDRELKASGFKSSLDTAMEGTGECEGGQEDLNLAHNLLSSLSAQPEAAGPASNILHSLGIPVPEPDQNGTQTDSSLTQNQPTHNRTAT